MVAVGDGSSLGLRNGAAKSVAKGSGPFDRNLESGLVWRFRLLFGGIAGGGVAEVVELGLPDKTRAAMLVSNGSGPWGLTMGDMPESARENV